MIMLLHDEGSRQFIRYDCLKLDCMSAIIQTLALLHPAGQRSCYHKQLHQVRIRGDRSHAYIELLESKFCGRDSWQS
jgi:hypothetical protein